MGSLARLSVNIIDHDAWCSALSETADDVEYLAEVLRPDGDKSEAELDEELIAKATALGIDASRSSTVERSAPSSPGGATTPSCARTPPSSSRATFRSISTSHSCPNFKTLPLNRTGGVGADSRRWSQTLGFALYDKYLAQLGPNITQPKFLKTKVANGQDQPRRKRFSFTGKGGISIITNGFKTRIRWTRRAAAGLGVATT